MELDTLGDLGDFLGGVAVVASLVYLAIQIRQNTRAVRSSSYHQAAEQTWNYCLAIAQDPSLAEILARRASGGPLTPTEQIRCNGADHALLFGFENMLRLHEEGLIDPDVWQNVVENSMTFLGTEAGRNLLVNRPGPLSQRLLARIEALPHLQPPAAPPSEDRVARNLAAVESHFHSEASSEVEAALETFTDDVVWEAPAPNGLDRRFVGKQAAARNYRELFASMRDVKFRFLQRFATADRVVDDSIVSFEVAKDGYWHFPLGSKIEMRLVHIFEMRDGRIAREIVFDMGRSV
jgi:ketosteroid isomerase-like protein